jgi:4-hydroxy-tetrahydrodipicolinate synthase
MALAVDWRVAAMEIVMLTGVWIPLITPFKDGQVDLASYRRLIEHYAACGVAGLFPLGTTGFCRHRRQ